MSMYPLKLCRARHSCTSKMHDFSKSSLSLFLYVNFCASSLLYTHTHAFSMFRSQELHATVTRDFSLHVVTHSISAYLFRLYQSFPNFLRNDDDRGKSVRSYARALSLSLFFLFYYYLFLLLFLLLFPSCSSTVAPQRRGSNALLQISISRPYRDRVCYLLAAS